MFNNAIECYNKVIQIHFERIQEWNNTFRGEKTPADCDNLLEKAAYNLAMIHNHLGNADIVKQLINDFLYVKA